MTLAQHVSPAADEFARLVDRYLEEYFRAHPSQATAVGFHQYDRFLEDYSQKALKSRITALRKFRTEFTRLDSRSLNFEEKTDRELVLGNIDSQLLDLEQIRMWEKDPDTYSSGITEAAYVIMSRQYASAPNRLEALIARERKMPAALLVARKNLKNPPRVYTEIAIQQLPGIIGFFQKDVAAAFRSVSDSKILAEFRSTNLAVIRALRQYESFLKKEVLPRSDGDFRIGAENYRKKLLYDEMVDIPLDRLLEIGMRDLRRNQEAFKRTAAKIDPKKTPEEVLKSLERDHPEPGSLISSVRNVLGGLREFIVNKNLVTLPSPVSPTVQETPPFMRALTFASMDTPGPFERVAKEAYFNVTLPESKWPRIRIEEHMAAFSRPVIVATAVHEAYPGHYVQFLWVQRAPSKVRKVIGAASNAEGWAHYCEQMMLDEGYGGGDLRLRLGQLQEALLRNARYIVGIQMHTGQMTFDEGVEFFVSEGFQTRANAERETKRGTSDPTYLVYTLGKLQILKLREDFRKIRGREFSLREFHDSFLQQGFPPVTLIRRDMLGNNTPVL